MSTGGLIKTKRLGAPEFTSISMLVALLACASLFGQSAARKIPPDTFHIHGTICRARERSAVPKVTVTFEGEKVSKTVYTDDRGVYKADLPVGLYSMTARSPDRALGLYQRPLFQVASPTSLVLDIALETYTRSSCDLGVLPSSTHIPDTNDEKDACGGQDFLPLPSDDGVPFQLLVEYESRKRTNRGYAYSARPLLPRPADPVFVAYNLFTLRADQVLYDVDSRKLEATGNVVLEKADGTTRSADLMTFKIENGEATPLPSLQTDKNTLSTNECFAKGGLGIVNTNLYIDLKSGRNELQLSAGNKWTGQSTPTQEVVIFYENKILSPQALPDGFDLSKSVVISFEGHKVRFFDFGKMSGGYYKRPRQN